MKVLYCRVSTAEQKTDRQKVDEKNYDFVVEDYCSGSIAFMERDGGKEILSLIERGISISLAVLTVDRLGRDLKDIINTIDFFTQKKITITFLSQGLTTLDSEGQENAITKMIISILGIVGEMERVQIRERQLGGIKAAKKAGIYKGRLAGTKEDVAKFLGKKANIKALSLLKKGTKAVEVARITGLNVNTITKIKKLGLQN